MKDDEDDVKEKPRTGKRKQAFLTKYPPEVIMPIAAKHFRFEEAEIIGVKIIEYENGEIAPCFEIRYSDGLEALVNIEKGNYRIHTKGNSAAQDRRESAD